MVFWENIVIFFPENESLPCTIPNIKWYYLIAYDSNMNSLENLNHLLVILNFSGTNNLVNSQYRKCIFN